MPKIETIRHSLAHIMAYAVQEFVLKTRFSTPGPSFGIGPTIEDGFYYDFELPRPLTPEDLPKIEEKMRELIRKNIVFKKKRVLKKEAKKIFKGQPYKLELIKEIPGKTVTLYQSGEFIDLCKGPHVRSTKEIPLDVFKLTKIAGAYWRGDEKNPMLTRIYGIAFKTKKELDNYLFRLEETEKRDHRVLGQALGFFHIDENIGPGLILWHPKGAILKRIIENYAIDEYLKAGYKLVSTPHIAKINIWQTSGHTEFYKGNMFPPMHLTEEKEDYQIKPMNCPFHIGIYKRSIKSYRQLPLRYTELGVVYRYEKSGVLHGLTRVRGFTQDDAHIFCTPEQLSDELAKTLRLALKILRAFGFKECDIFLSTRPKKYVGSLESWRKAENSLKYALRKLKVKYRVDPYEGVFYGPKIDIKIKDSLGRPWQCTTIQVDFNIPERFNLTYIDKKGRKKEPIMIHRALLGSIERLIGVLLEHYGGALPLWLSPEQIWVIPVGSRHRKYARGIGGILDEKGLRVIVKNEAETVSKKIREGEIQKIPYMLVVGDKETKLMAVRVRDRKKGDIGIMKLDKFIKKVEKEIERKK